MEWRQVYKMIVGIGSLWLLPMQILAAESMFSSRLPVIIAAVSALLLLFVFLWIRNRSNNRHTNNTLDTVKQALLKSNSDTGEYSSGGALENTESLMEFLRIKSAKPRIKKEMFNLNNVFNELEGSLATQFKNSSVELIFDIDRDVPKYLVGDPLQLGNILFNLSKNMIVNGTHAEMSIKVLQHISSKRGNEIVFEMSNRQITFSETECNILLEPENEALSSEERGMGFYIAKVLISLMQGKVEIQSSVKHGTVIHISLPFEIYKKNELRKYRLPSKSLVNKKVFLADSSTASANAIKKMLQYFRYKVVMVSASQVQKQKPNLLLYDIVIFDEKVLNADLLAHIKQIKEESDIKVVLLSSIFSTQENRWEDGVFDVFAKKPFSQERIFEVILDLYDHTVKLPSAPVKVEKKISRKRIHRELFEDRAEISMNSFRDFSGTSVLIVDDNKINQKILINVLGKSGMQLDIASNGQEAIDMTVGTGKVYDLVLMDINMPVMDGYAATATMRVDPVYATIPIVALTALVMESEVEKMFAKGASGYLSKPLRVGQLYAAFEYFLEKSENAVSEKKAPPPLQHIQGLNTTLGVANSNGSMIAYIGILNEFISAYGKSDIAMRSLIDDRKYAQTKILCNDMRQLTKIIGAKKMYDVVDTMYKVFLYNNEEMLPKYIEAYRRELESLTDAIQEYLKGVEV
jgi:CheY-like chemotaxis protein